MRMRRVDSLRTRHGGSGGCSITGATLGRSGAILSLAVVADALMLRIGDRLDDIVCVPHVPPIARLLLSQPASMLGVVWVGAIHAAVRGTHAEERRAMPV